MVFMDEKQFRGGATMHGPKPRSHAIKLNKKVRRLGLKIALTARAAEGKVSICLSLSRLCKFAMYFHFLVIYHCIITKKYLN